MLSLALSEYQVDGIIIPIVAEGSGTIRVQGERIIIIIQLWLKENIQIC
jgi:hypothetical protein